VLKPLADGAGHTFDRGIQFITVAAVRGLVLSVSPPRVGMNGLSRSSAPPDAPLDHRDHPRGRRAPLDAGSRGPDRHLPLPDGADPADTCRGRAADGSVDGFSASLLIVTALAAAFLLLIGYAVRTAAGGLAVHGPQIQEAYLGP
jgi:hypothetical protein